MQINHGGWQWQAWTFIEWLRLDLGEFFPCEGGVWGFHWLGMKSLCWLHGWCERWIFPMAFSWLDLLQYFFSMLANGKRSVLTDATKYRSCKRIRIFDPFFPGLRVRNRFSSYAFRQCPERCQIPLKARRRVHRQGVVDFSVCPAIRRDNFPTRHHHHLSRSHSLKTFITDKKTQLTSWTERLGFLPRSFPSQTWTRRTSIETDLRLNIAKACCVALG